MRLRVGAPTADDIDVLNLTWGAGDDNAWPDHQRLRAKNCDVHAVNDWRLSQLPGEPVSFKCVYTINVEHPDRQAAEYTKLQKLARWVVQEQQTRWEWRQAGSADGGRAGGRQAGGRRAGGRPPAEGHRAGCRSGRTGDGGRAERDPLRAKKGLHVDDIPGPCTKTYNTNTLLLLIYLDQNLWRTPSTLGIPGFTSDAEAGQLLS